MRSIADGWTTRAASEPDDHGVEWLAHADKYGRRSMPIPASLVHLKRRASEKQWPEARSWCEQRQVNKGYVLRKKGKPDPTPAKAEERTASHCLPLPAQFRACPHGCVLEAHKEQTDHFGGVTQTMTVVPNRPGTICSSTATSGRTASRAIGGGQEETGRGKQRWRVGDLLADDGIEGSKADPEEIEE